MAEAPSVVPNQTDLLYEAIMGAFNRGGKNSVNVSDFSNGANPYIDALMAFANEQAGAPPNLDAMVKQIVDKSATAFAPSKANMTSAGAYTSEVQKQLQQKAQQDAIAAAMNAVSNAMNERSNMRLKALDAASNAKVNADRNAVSIAAQSKQGAGANPLTALLVKAGIDILKPKAMDAIKNGGTLFGNLFGGSGDGIGGHNLDTGLTDFSTNFLNSGFNDAETYSPDQMESSNLVDSYTQFQDAMLGNGGGSDIGNLLFDSSNIDYSNLFSADSASDYDFGSLIENVAPQEDLSWLTNGFSDSSWF